MNDTNPGIQIELDNFHHQPFQELRGKVRITAANPPRSLELRIFWFTKGRGDEEASVVHRLSLNPTQALTDFIWELPAAPYSFAGQLITLAWAVEVVDERENSLDLVPFLLSPSGEEVQLEALPDHTLKGKLAKRFGSKRVGSKQAGTKRAR